MKPGGNDQNVSTACHPSSPPKLSVKLQPDSAYMRSKIGCSFAAVAIKSFLGAAMHEAPESEVEIAAKMQVIELRFEPGGEGFADAATANAAIDEYIRLVAALSHFSARRRAGPLPGRS
jgi:hypothetical protein